MAILLAHLTDLHWNHRNTPRISAAALVRAIASSATPSTSDIILLLTGDLAYSGDPAEYDGLLAVLQEVVAEFIRVIPGTKVHLVPCPGNHDCRIVDKTKRAKDVASFFSTTKKADRDRKYPTTYEALSAPLDAYNRFVQNPLFAQPMQPDSNSDVHRLVSGDIVRWYVINTVDHKRITIASLNSALLTNIKERQGKLYIPISIISTSWRPMIGEDLSIAIYHHPLNWLEASNAKEVRRYLEYNFDMSFSGHEHEASQPRITHLPDVRTIAVEGGTLWDPETPSVSDFSVTDLDLDSDHLKWDHYSHRTDAYHRVDSSSQTLKLRRPSRSRPEFTPHNEARLNASDITLQNRTRGTLTINDIFVSPDLRPFKLDPRDTPSNAVGTDALETLFKAKRAVVVGDADSGRTTLAKRLCDSLLKAHDLLPIFFSGEETRLSDTSFVEQIEHAFLDQYSSPSQDAYRQSDRARRAVVVDDFDRLGLRGPARARLIHAMWHHADYVCLFSLQSSQALEEMLSASLESQFEHFEIQPFSYRLRSALASKWLAPPDDNQAMDAAYYKKLHAIERALNTMVGRNVVPSYPTYILAIL